MPQEPELSVIDTFTPCLILESCEFDNLLLPGSTLYFDYGGFTQTPLYDGYVDNISDSLERDGRYSQLKRDWEAEYSCCDRIHALRLALDHASDSQKTNIWVPNDSTAQEALTRWQQLRR